MDAETSTLVPAVGRESSVPRVRRPHLTIGPSHGWVALRLREMWQFRDLLFALAGRDVKLRYKQTALGVIWVVLQPLMAAGIFSFVFGKVARLSSDGQPYFIFAFTGEPAGGRNDVKPFLLSVFSQPLGAWIETSSTRVGSAASSALPVGAAARASSAALASAAAFASVAALASARAFASELNCKTPRPWLRH